MVVGVTAFAVAGCRPDDTGAVLLHFNARTDAALPATYSSSTAAAAFTGDGLVHLTATSNQGILRLVIAGPLVDGARIELSPDDEPLHFAIGDADWASRGGAIEVLDAYGTMVTFVDVPMEARSASAAGTFVFGGGGTFR